LILVTEAIRTNSGLSTYIIALFILVKDIFNYLMLLMLLHMLFYYLQLVNAILES